VGEGRLLALDKGRLFDVGGFEREKNVEGKMNCGRESARGRLLKGKELLKRG
jgi:hypothetical protein